MKNVFAVVIDWIADSGESDANVSLFDSLDKAQKYMKQESIAELANRVGDSIYYDKSDEKTVAAMKALLTDFKGEIDTVDDEEDANYVIEASPTHFTCFKQGCYSVDHINIIIQERSVE